MRTSVIFTASHFFLITGSAEMIIPHLIFLALHLPYATGYKNQLSSSPWLNIKTNSKGIFSEISINEHSSNLFGLGWRLY